MLATIQAEHNVKIEAMRQQSRVAVKASRSRGSRPGFADVALGGTSNYLWNHSLGQFSQQYQHYRDVPFTAIRPIAVRVAAQPIMVGRQTKRRPPGKPKKDLLRWRMKNFAPSHIKAIAESIDPIHDHELHDLFDQPNEVLTQWMTNYLTIASLQITGVAYWWIIGETTAPDSRITHIYYIPAHWVQPVHDKDKSIAFAKWLITPPGISEPTPVEGHEIVMFRYPDPSDPLGSVSPMQAQAKAVDIDEYIQTSQVQSYRNGVRPSLILKAGRLFDTEGHQLNVRPLLTPEQRSQLINAIKFAHAGVINHGEPIIVDGLIEDVEPWDRSPAEMDWRDSFTMNKSRIMQGFGVNPISAGEVEGANRASAYVADYHLCANVLNPLMTMMSQVMTMRIAPRYQYSDRERLYIWMEECRPFDADLRLAEMQFLADQKWLRGNEAREAFGLEPHDDLDELPEPEPPPQVVAPPGAEGGTTETDEDKKAQRKIGRKIKEEAKKLLNATPAGERRGLDFFVRGLCSAKKSSASTARKRSAKKRDRSR